MCDGTAEDAIQVCAAAVVHHGWATMSVTGSLPWSYTIGLRWYLDVPELIIVGWRLEAAEAVFHHVVHAIESGLEPVRGHDERIGDGRVGFGRVDPSNLTGEWFAQWSPVAQATGHAGVSLRALQVQPECAAGCGEPHDVIDNLLATRCNPDHATRRRLAALGAAGGWTGGRDGRR